MPQVLSALAAGSLPDNGLIALVTRQRLVTIVVGCTHDPAAVYLLITIFILFYFYIYLESEPCSVLTCLDGALDFYLGGSLTETLIKK